jgi:hypothetical protein
VRAILTDYEGLPRVNPGIKKVELLDSAGTGARMRVTSGVCMLLICLDYTWVQNVTTSPAGDVVAVVDGTEGDFREGRARWRFRADAARTRLVFDGYVVPSFWFPPLLGPWLIKRKLLEEALETAVGVERLAKGS